jgi:hypothetical protein
MWSKQAIDVMKNISNVLDNNNNPLSSPHRSMDGVVTFARL